MVELNEILNVIIKMEFELYGHMLNASGVIVGAACFLIIMISRWTCIVGEYHFTKKLWIAFLIFGLICITTAFFMINIMFSSVVAMLGFTYLWGINEVIEQEERVKKGWFPMNPKRK